MSLLYDATDDFLTAHTYAEESLRLYEALEKVHPGVFEQLLKRSHDQHRYCSLRSKGSEITKSGCVGDTEDESLGITRDDPVGYTV